MSDSAAWRRWSAIEPILDAALDLSPNERDAYLKAATGDDAELRAAVEALLRSAESAAGEFTIGAAGAYPELVAHLARDAIPVSEQIGPYRIVGRAGEGGMGVVYVAERADDQYRSRVALKLMRRGIDDPALVRRFLDERQILASLVHPGIARLYDGGVTADGRPWFAMELVDGTPISHFCDAKGLAIDQRLRLTLSVCDAVAYAHRNFVIHRDLKPYNILVDREGRVRVVDFGIAKVMEAATSESAQAPTSVPALTPGYASPELLRGQRASAASDVYSLGVILYRLLTGRRPYRVSGGADEDVAKTVLESQHVAPSAMAWRADAGMLASRRTSARGLARRLRGDLDAIVLKAMAKDPDHRYATVEEFAADIRRHLDRRPVGVRPATWRYRGMKFVRRNLFGVAAVTTVVLLGAAFSISARAQLRRVEKERRIAQEVASFLTSLFSAPDPRRHRGNPMTARELLDSAAARIDSELSHDPRVRAALLSIMGRTYWGLGLNAEAEPLLRAALDLRGESSDDMADRIRDLVLLTDIRTVSGDLVAAESLGRSALATARDHYPPGHSALSSPLRRLGYALSNAGRWNEAESLLTETVAIQRAQPPDSSAMQLAFSLSALAELRHVRGDVAAATVLWREALSIAQRSPRQELYVANFEMSLAEALHNQGDTAAIALATHSLSSLRRLLGEDHAGVRRQMGRLAEILADQGQLRSAESLYVAALGSQRFRPPESQTAALMMGGLGRVLLEQGHARRAEPLLRRALSYYEKTLPDWQYAWVEQLLGSALVVQKRFREAEPLLVRSFNVRKGHWGEHSEWTQRSIRALVTFYEVTGDQKTAGDYRAKLR